MGDAFATADGAISEDDHVFPGARWDRRVGEGFGEGAKGLGDEGGEMREGSDGWRKVSVLGNNFLAGDRGDVIGKEGKPRDCIVPFGGGAV